MPQPSPNDIHLNSGLKQMNGGGMAKDMRGDRSGLSIRTLFQNLNSMSANDFVDSESSQGRSFARGEDRGFW